MWDTNEEKKFTEKKNKKHYNSDHIKEYMRVENQHTLKNQQNNIFFMN